jgi:hypothetical protein
MNRDGEKKLVLGVVGLVCVTVLCLLLFIALWAYKEIVATTLLVLLVLVVAVYLWGMINEQRLRHVRYHHREETPLPTSQYPPYIQGTQATGPYSLPVQPNQYYQPLAYYHQRHGDVKE